MESPVMVSVLMAVYNTPFNVIKRAIDSVLNQTFKEFELVIVDDGSTKDVNGQLLNYVILNQEKIRYLWHSNRGQAESINEGVKISKGIFITIIDADDEYTPLHLQRCFEEIKNFDLIASTSLTVVDKEEDYYVPDKNNTSKLIHVDECILFATLFGKKEVFEAVKFQQKYAADAQFFELASEKFSVNKTNLRTYVYYRNNSNSLVSKMKIGKK